MSSIPSNKSTSLPSIVNLKASLLPLKNSNLILLNLTSALLNFSVLFILLASDIAFHCSISFLYSYNPWISILAVSLSNSGSGSNLEYTSEWFLANSFIDLLCPIGFPKLASVAVAYKYA
mgnify:FL=1